MGYRSSAAEYRYSEAPDSAAGVVEAVILPMLLLGPPLVLLRHPLVLLRPLLSPLLMLLW